VERQNLNCAAVRVDAGEELGAGVLADDGWAETGGGVADLGARLARFACAQQRIGLTCANEA
jgi:hypothetical protein